MGSGDGIAPDRQTPKPEPQGGLLSHPWRRVAAESYRQCRFIPNRPRITNLDPNLQIPDRRGALLARLTHAQVVKHLEHLLAGGANFVTLRQVDPADRCRGVKQKLRWAGNVGAANAASSMQQVVAANDFRLGVGEKREGVALLLAMRPRDLRWVHADSHNAHTARGEFVQLLLKTPQLGVAVGSPVASVENQQRPPRVLLAGGFAGLPRWCHREEIGEPHWLARRVLQRKVGRFLTDLRRALRGRQLSLA